MTKQQTGTKKIDNPANQPRGNHHPSYKLIMSETQQVLDAESVTYDKNKLNVSTLNERESHVFKLLINLLTQRAVFHFYNPAKNSKLV